MQHQRTGLSMSQETYLHSEIISNIAKFPTIQAVPFDSQSPQRFLERLQSTGYSTANNTDAGFAYDAVWAIALALNTTGQRLHARTGLENFTYTDHHMAISFKKGLLATRFTGLTVISC